MRRAGWWVAWVVVGAARRALFWAAYRATRAGLWARGTAERWLAAERRCCDRCEERTADPPPGGGKEGGGAPPGGFSPK